MYLANCCDDKWNWGNDRLFMITEIVKNIIASNTNYNDVEMNNNNNIYW